MSRKPWLNLILVLALLGGMFPAWLGAPPPVLAGGGIWESYIVLNSLYYDVNANTGNPDFNQQNLGVFTPGSNPLTLNGGEVKTWKNNGTDIQSARLMYRVYPLNSPSGSFGSVNLSWQADLGGNDQKWGANDATIDLLSGLSDGDYTLEVYYEATTNGVDAPTTLYDNNNGNNYKATFTVSSTPGALGLLETRALWLDVDVIAWNGTAGASYRLLYDPDGGMTAAAEETVCSFTPTLPTAPCYVALTIDGTVSGYWKNPNADGKTRLRTGLSAEAAKHLLRGQTAVAAYNSGGTRVMATRTQIQSVLDALYAADAVNATLGVVYAGATPSVHVWAPTAQSVALLRFETSTDNVTHTHALSLDPTSGVWSITGQPDWDRHFYLFDVAVYVPAVDAIVNNLVTDPYAVSLSTDSLRSQFVNLADADLKPAGWDDLEKPELEHFTDITIYEMHVRDFSINDSSVLTQAHRGTYVAFTYDGNYHPLSAGMAHLLALQDAGLTHVHLLPAFDIATVPEADVPREVWPYPSGYARDGEEPQAIVGAQRADDGFNWGYDPYHYGVPEGSYSTDPDGAQRILEFRQMVQALNANGLRLVLDVVYNHTSAKGQEAKSVFDKIVPGYYYRYDASGVLQHSSCCPDTATEYTMMEKLMLDTLVRFAVEYKVDGFRFDLMNLHTRQNMLDVQSALAAVDPDIYLYGEGWDFGSAKDKGLTTCPNCYAHKYNMTGAGIGLFNDVIRDATHGGYNEHPVGIRKQGFSNGLSYDWNGYEYDNRYQSDLHAVMDRLRSALRGSGDDWNGQGSPFTAAPQESVPYVEKHDNETLFDQNVFKLPNGAGSDNPGWIGSGIPTTEMSARVRAQNVGLSLMTLAQGVPFFHAGSDILRSKSLDRNTYDSGDWFNRLYWDYSHNNFGQGLPSAWDNAGRWDIMRPLLANASLDPAPADMAFAAAQFREFLRIRYSSPLFRLRTRAAINARVTHHNTANTHDGLLIMQLSDAPTPSLDPRWETLLVFFNANKIAQTYTIAAAAGQDFTLHPVHTDGVDDDPVITGGASFNNLTGAFIIPARTTVVFVSEDALTPPPESDINWVGDMYPVGGESAEYAEGVSDFHTVYVQVYQEGVTDAPGQGAGIACYLHWGRYGASWTDTQMSYHVDVSNNDEYMLAVDVSALAPGIYGYTAYCTADAGASKRWRSGEDGLLAIVPADDPTPPPPGGVFVHLFEWRWTDIAQECAFLGEQGYTAVQVSPPQEHIQGAEWWTRYQPVSYMLTSRSGDLAEFQAMIAACAAAGVDIYVDAIVNHMASPGFDPITRYGFDDTPYRKYHYPYPEATLFGPENFNAASGRCPTPSGEIEDYSSRRQVQYCELLGLDDLNYDIPDTVARVQAYLNGLIAMGVKGFRIDAAKHTFAYDLERLYAGLDDLPGGGRPYLFHEVIGAADEPVKEFEYLYLGDVTEFEASNSLGWFFSDNTGCDGTLSGLDSYGGAGYMPAHLAQVFVNNHDNQRGHGTGSNCIVTYQDDAAHDLATVFLLAHPYGHPSVMSSYYFADDNQGPPATGVYSGGDPVGCNATDWVCEHRAPAIANMVQFRQATHGAEVTNWQVIAPDHIAFGRGDRGFVALNRTGSPATTTYQTGLPEGTYCDAISGGRSATGATCAGIEVTVNASGQIVDYPLDALSAFAIYQGMQPGYYILTMAVVGGGTVEPAIGNHVFAQNSLVPITATPESGWEFAGWLGDVLDAEAESTSVLVDAHKTVTATFTALEICTPLTAVALTLLTSGNLYTDTLVQLRADIAPEGATLPYTYTVDYGAGPGAPLTSSDNPLLLNHTWPVTGAYTVEIAAWNCAMPVPVTDTVQVTILEKLGYTIYLPLVIRAGP